jgi:SH3-like domain-containing protein
MRANIYIRKDNEARWNDIPNKSAWVNERLDQTQRSAVYSTKTRQTKTLPPTDLLDRAKVDLCPHGYAKGLCKIEKCNRKYQ